MRKKLVLLLMLACVSMVSCGKSEVKDSSRVVGSSKVYEVTEEFLEGADSTEAVTGNTIEDFFEEIDSSEKEESNVSDVTIKGAEERANLRNTYADFDFSKDGTDIAFEDYPWFVLPSDASPFDYYTYQMIICSINEYYGGDVPDVYTCNIATDIVSLETNMVFKVKVTGEKSTLYVGINGYEYTTSVEVED